MPPSPPMSAKSTAHSGAVASSKCQKCGALTSQSLRYCPACGVDLGCPNVRVAEAPEEVEALKARFEVARGKTDKRGLSAEFAALVSAVGVESHVVVAMPPIFARSLLVDPRLLYKDYEDLVGAGNRTPAPFGNDSERHAVGGKLFGCYASEIRYGVLSLDGSGLPNYGLVFAQLRDVAIADRVTCFHENSYLFLQEHRVSIGEPLPCGYRSSWRNRDQLVAAKLEPGLTGGSKVSDWSRQLVLRGRTREEDSCVETHIFGSFNADSIESFGFAGPGTSREERNDIDCIKELFARRLSPGGTA